jgi:hypothetical protein
MHGATLPAETRNYDRLALAGTTTADAAAKLLAPFLPKPRAVKTSKVKETKIVASKTAKPVHLAAHHSAAKPTRIATHVAARTKHAAVTHSGHHRVKSA